MLQTFARITVLVSALVLTAGVPTFARPAAAAPAQPYHVETCERHSEGPDEYEICLESRGVVQVTESASDITVSTFGGRTSFTATENGKVVNTGENAEHITIVAKNGVDQVFHQRGSGSFVTAEGLTCTVRYNTVYVTGEVRHEVVSFECNSLAVPAMGTSHQRTPAAWTTPR